MNTDAFQQFTLWIIFLIAVGYLAVAWLSWRVFFFYGVHRAAKWIVVGTVMVTASWGLINGGTQLFIPAGTELRRILILTSLIGIFAGVICEGIGLYQIYSRGIRHRG